MKASRFSLLILLPAFLLTASGAELDPALVIVERSAHRRVWQRDEWMPLNDGRTVNRPHRVVEVASGLHYSEGGEWKESRAEIEIVADGAAATRGLHQVHFNVNVNTVGAVRITTPDKRTLRTHVIGLAYTTKDQSVLFAPVRDADGLLFPPNQILYSDAFAGGVRADIRLSYTQTGLESDVILRSRLPDPADWNLNEDEVMVEVWHAFDEVPEPVITTRTRRGETDQTIDLGSMRLVRGSVFALDAQPSRMSGAPVSKTWLREANRTFLIESVPYRAIRAELKELPELQAAVGGRASRVPNLALLTAPSREGLAKRVPPAPAPTAAKPIQMALATRALEQVRGLVLDYLLVNADTETLTLAADQTYFISGPVYPDSVVIEGNTVAKFERDAFIYVSSTIDCRTSAHHPALFVAKDDDTVGEKISGSTGSPSGFYASPTLWMEQPGQVLHDLRISHAAWGLIVDYDTTVRHAQFTFCEVPIQLSLCTLTLDNTLFYQATTVFYGGYEAVIDARHVTGHLIHGLVYAPDDLFALNLTNSLLVNVTNWGTMLYYTNAVVMTGDEAELQTVGAGGHYLANGSAYRAAGSTNIPSALLTDLRQRTTYPPTVITNATISTNLTLALIAPRGANAPDLGYAYAPLDYVFGSNVLTNATLTIPAGVVLGTFTPGSNTHGLLLRSGANVIGAGSPTNVARFVRYNLAQEQANSAWASSNAGAQMRVPNQHTATAPTGNFRFTDWSVPEGRPWHFDAQPTNRTAFVFRDSQFTGGKLRSSVAQVAFTNCLFHRVNGYAEEHPLTITNRWFNNTAYGGTWSFFNTHGGPWELYNNAFSGTADLSCDAGLSHGWNAYLPGAPGLCGWPTWSNSLITNIVFQSGPLGDFYLTNTSPLLNRGTNNATNFALYHFTTTTNQVKETNSTTDIGFHYVALNGSALPMDMEADGIPDYAEDTNGNGVAHTNAPLFETNWKVDDGGDDPDGDWMTNLQEYQAGTNPHDTMLVAWGLNADGQCAVPLNLRNVVSMSGGFFHSDVATENGSVLCWGNNAHGQTTVPSGLGNVTSVVAGPYHQLALRKDGTVSFWGHWWDNNFHTITDPANLTNVMALAAGADHDVVLRSNGTVFVWGLTNTAYSAVPADVSNIVAVAAGWSHNVALKADGRVRAWGYGFSGFGWNLTNVPSGLSNVMAIAVGAYHTLALKSDGTVVAWGAGNSTNGGFFQDKRQSIVPSGLSNVIAISAGGYSSLALKGDGTIAAWGQLSLPVATLTGIQKIALGNEAFGLGVRGGRLTPFIRDQPASTTGQASGQITFTTEALAIAGVHYQWLFNGVSIDGATNSALLLTNLTMAQEGGFSVIASSGAGSVTSVVATLTISGVAPGEIRVWGANANNQKQIPWCLGDVIAAAGGTRHIVAVKEGGRVAAWGTNDYNQTSVPSSATNIVAVACGNDHTLVVNEGGMVLAWGRNDFSQTNISNEATNVKAISAGGHQSLALRQDTSVRQWGQTFGSVPASVTNVLAIASGTNFHLALLSNATVIAWGRNTYGQTNVPAGLTNVVAVAAGGAHALALRKDGTVVAWGANGSGQTNVPAGLTNIMGLAAGYAHSLALGNDGRVFAWGDNGSGQTNVPSVFTNAHTKAVAAGASNSLALVFSSLAQYPIDVSKDLLLIYNTNSADSLAIKNYYLTNRPFVRNANVLGIGGSVGESYANLAQFTNDLLNPLLGWYAQNPTKPPGYIICFLDVPTRFDPNGGESVGNLIRFFLKYPKPFVNYINMGAPPDYIPTETNRLPDCFAYIDKLARFGSNYSPGKLVISASAGGYGNDYYFLDDEIRYYNTTNHTPTAAVFMAGYYNGLIAQGISSNWLNYLPSDTASNMVRYATNLAGFMNWGAYGWNSYYAQPGGGVQFVGKAEWYIIATAESYNGVRHSAGQGDYAEWFWHDAFSRTNYQGTPVGAVGHVDEPTTAGVQDGTVYLGSWQSGKYFAICAWASQRTSYLLVVGDPFVRR